MVRGRRSRRPVRGTRGHRGWDRRRAGGLRAVEAGFAANEDDYYDELHAATVDATRQAVRDRERADDQQLVHAVQSTDDLVRTARV
jgi:nucleolar protein 56